jgi:hypothetical protein
MENPSNTNAESPSLLRKVAGFVVTAALIGLVLMLSALLVIVILTAGAMTWGYLWWKTRDLRKQMRQHPSVDGMNDGEVIRGKVIEGEVIRVAGSSYRVER